jgi:hypothetical protein
MARTLESGLGDLKVGTWVAVSMSINASRLAGAPPMLVKRPPT